tara:strand:+ start:53894 stop:55597 length:1704 start_codon:yes stop_codon:yes gene_type:complete
MDETTEPPADEEAGENAESPARQRLRATRDRILHELREHYDESPVRWREIVSLFLIIVLCDVTVYRGSGFAGDAVLVAGMSLLLAVGVPSKRPQVATWVFAVLVAGASTRLVWCGSGLSVAAGLVVMFGFAMSLVGRTPYMIHIAVFATQTFAAGHRGLNHYWNAAARIRPPARVQNLFTWILPVIALLVFGALFVFANPDLASAVGARFSDLFDVLGKWWQDFSPAPFEVLFCIGAGWIAIGLLRPILPTSSDTDDPRPASEPIEVSVEPTPAPLFEAFRNTLFMVVGLFAGYLVFEFQTLWFREFPKGFHYSGYAHEGAAWLTVALALATAMLSLMFRGSVLNDPRFSTLRKLSWLWSIENVVLALAVYNRLSIYVNFNGMTRMRTVGLLGMTSVLVGFLLVVRKISKGHDFRWLVRRQLWTVAFAVYLYAVLPVDAWVMHHNVQRVLAGDLSPAVQISVHPTSAEGVLEMFPLTKCDDEAIREGVKATLVRYFQRSKHYRDWSRSLSKPITRNPEPPDWTAMQFADDWLLDELSEACKAWPEYDDQEKMDAAITRFREHTWQWY